MKLLLGLFGLTLLSLALAAPVHDSDEVETTTKRRTNKEKVIFFAEYCYP